MRSRINFCTKENGMPGRCSARNLSSLVGYAGPACRIVRPVDSSSCPPSVITESMCDVVSVLPKPNCGQLRWRAQIAMPGLYPVVEIVKLLPNEATADARCHGTEWLVHGARTCTRTCFIDCPIALNGGGYPYIFHAVCPGHGQPKLAGNENPFSGIEN